MSNTRKPRNGAELLKSIQPQMAEVSCKVCLRPDLLNEYNTEVEELDRLREEGDRLRKQAEASKGGRMASRKSPGELENERQQREAAERVRAVEERMAEYEVEFVFHGIPKDKWRDLVDANPPREDNQFDLLAGYNRDTLLDELVRPSLVDPEFDDCADQDCAHEDCFTWQYLAKLLNAGQWNRLRENARMANDGVAEVPKSRTASDILSKVAAASRPPETSESPPADSKAGSPSESSST